MTEVVSIPEMDVVQYMYEQGWTDGLPVVPPTPEKLAAMLAGGEPGDVLGSVPAWRRTVHAEIVAINAVIADCRPAYFPVVLTAVQAMLDPIYNINVVAASAGGAALCVMVSGPLAAEIGMTATHNALGSGNRANATIGRAVRLVVANSLGAKTGRLDASSMGHPGKYTFCFAERPPLRRWGSLAVDKGYSPADTTVTIMGTEAPCQMGNHLRSGGDHHRAGIPSRHDSRTGWQGRRRGVCYSSSAQSVRRCRSAARDGLPSAMVDRRSPCNPQGGFSVTTIEIMVPELTDGPVAAGTHVWPYGAHLTNVHAFTLIDNSKPKATQLLAMISERLKARTQVGHVEMLSRGRAGRVLDDEEIAAIASSSDAVIAGLGDCGALVRLAVPAAIKIEIAGVPSTLLMTDVFLGAGAEFASTMRMPGDHCAGGSSSGLCQKTPRNWKPVSTRSWSRSWYN
jgi:hypothetical protein